ncbi:N-acetylmuramoyl-L-alanine amidase CwlD [Falsibacillus albus]|uniref:N-acetylmuramoyl-L-alanine amidase CwlD n=1 Tax=Falsibacillus albus TaxID=2478915 RepID=A0A3L7JN77_9BACI|nr:N-acetylmuramoyl-L-alanine amidase CwlD [Falsibacillus albus]RLQ91725.1 N-acetylmuramoyl-L-alanine amidase CwlD [Falsibacillus albus]
MGRRMKLGIFIASALVLFLLFQFKLYENDSWKSWNLPLSGKIIYLDAGHGGPDGGAGDQDALEKDISLKVTLKVRDYLQEQGALVILTREKDQDLAAEDTKGYSRRKTEDLKKRLKLINESKADLFISIHLNSIPSPQWSGAQTFFAPQYEENQKVAKFIQDELVKNLQNTNREAKAINNVYILKHAKKPGALVEVGFLSNPSERARLKKDDYQEKISASIYNGIMRYFTNEPSLK